MREFPARLSSGATMAVVAVTRARIQLSAGETPGRDARVLRISLLQRRRRRSHEVRRRLGPRHEAGTYHSDSGARRRRSRAAGREAGRRLPRASARMGGLGPAGARRAACGPVTTRRPASTPRARASSAQSGTATSSAPSDADAARVADANDAGSCPRPACDYIVWHEPSGDRQRTRSALARRAPCSRDQFAIARDWTRVSCIPIFVP